MKKIMRSGKTISCILLLLVLIAFGFYLFHSQRRQILVPERRICWTPGLPRAFPYPRQTVMVEAVPDQDISGAIMRAIASLPDGGIVQIPAGIWRVEKTIVIDRDSIVLRGAGFNPDGSLKSSLLFFLRSDRRMNCIEIGRGQSGLPVREVVAGAERGSYRLTLSDSTGFKPRDLAQVEQSADLTDPAFRYTVHDDSWVRYEATSLVNQIVEVKGVSPLLHRITLRQPLYLDYLPRLLPRVRRCDFVKHVAIEHLRISLDAAVRPPSGHNIFFDNAAWCLVRQVESDHMTGYDAHVRLRNCYRCEVRDSYLHDTYAEYHGYGVELLHATDCLVENTIIARCSTAVLVHVGATGNVVAYNYDRENTYNERIDRYAPFLGGVGLHGHYSTYTLFEGNVTETLFVDNWWGQSGPGNTFARNRVTRWGIQVLPTVMVEHEGMEVVLGSFDQNFIGNVIAARSPLIEIAASLNTPEHMTLFHGNRCAGVTCWMLGIRSYDLPASYYLRGTPRFFNGEAVRSDLGPLHYSDGAIPAEQRWQSGRLIPVSD